VTIADAIDILITDRQNLAAGRQSFVPAPSRPLYLDIIVDVAIFPQKADRSKIKSQ